MLHVLTDDFANMRHKWVKKGYLHTTCFLRLDEKEAEPQVIRLQVYDTYEQEAGPKFQLYVYFGCVQEAGP